MKILFVQEIPEIRSIKTSLMLREHGHHVDCVTTAALSSFRNDLGGIKPFNSEFTIKDKFHLPGIFEGYDLIHFHNSPDRIGLITLAGDKPVIWDCHDLVTTLDIKDPRGSDEIIEFFLYHKSQGSIFASRGFKNECEEKYTKSKTPSIITENYPAKWMIPKEKLPKLSDKDKKIHIVYAGSISEERENHRFFYPLFKKLTSLSDQIVLHVYPAISPRATKLKVGQQIVLDQFNFYKIPSDTLIIHKPVSVIDLIKELSQYDFGLLPFNKAYQFTQLFTPNKLYEYSAAGLKILSQHYETVDEVSKDWENIIYYDRIDGSLLKQLQNHSQLKIPIVPVFEDQYKQYLKIYEEVI